MEAPEFLELVRLWTATCIRSCVRRHHCLAAILFVDAALTWAMRPGQMRQRKIKGGSTSLQQTILSRRKSHIKKTNVFQASEAKTARQISWCWINAPSRSTRASLTLTSIYRTICSFFLVTHTWCEYGIHILYLQHSSTRIMPWVVNFVNEISYCNSRLEIKLVDRCWGTHKEISIFPVLKRFEFKKCTISRYYAAGLKMINWKSCIILLSG